MGLFATVLLLPAPGAMPILAWRTAALAILMAVWWITEPIPIAATSLLPIPLLPLLGVSGVEGATAPYGNSVIFLFLGGFLLAAALEKTGLHRRVAFHIIRRVGMRPRRLLLGFMIATAAVSALVSNTATAALMFPMAISLIALVDPARNEGDESGFASALMLGLAWAASLGGLATLIGTPPNALLAGYMNEAHGREIGFARWMMLGVPLAAAAVPLGWLLLMKMHTLPEESGAGSAVVEREIIELGPISPAERLVAAITLVIAVAWMFRPLLQRQIAGLSDAGVAIIGALLLFVIPVSGADPRPVLGAGDIDRIPWSVLVLFGGGLSLAAAMEKSGLAEAIGAGVTWIRLLPPLVVVLAIVTMILFLSEIASNTAIAAAFLPIVGAAAVGMGEDALFLAIPATLAASCAFMLPVGTPPNAIVYGSGRVELGRMMRAGFWMNLTMIALITIASRWALALFSR